MPDDTSIPFLDHLTPPSSVVSELLKIQCRRTDNTKSITWAANIDCLSVRDRTANILELAPKPPSGKLSNEYVAVSYVWHQLTAYDSEASGKYQTFREEPGSLEQCKTRDEVLDRVIRYAEYNDVERFWIDRECVNQQDKEAHQLAMDSMDLVYSQSSNPLGLLATTLFTQRQVNLLQELLRGKLVEIRPDGHPILDLSFDTSIFDEALNLLAHLSIDDWWHRAWVYQEEYRSSTRMCLLIRHNPGLKKLRDFGKIPGEMCIPAAKFREQATLFLLAYSREGTPNLAPTCDRLCMTFSRYSLLYCLGKVTDRKAMSSKIYQDVGRRRITRPFDILPIIANTCDYGVRLRSETMAHDNHSLSVCLIALLLLNGELIKAKPDATLDFRTMNVYRLIDAISLDAMEPPVEQKELTFLKACRLHNVSLSSEGMRTMGHLWEIRSCLGTKGWHCSDRRTPKNFRGGLQPFEMDCLLQLSHELQQGGNSLLSERIQEYLQLDDEHGHDPPPAKQYMDLMAGKLVEAIRAGQCLYLAQKRGYSQVESVFAAEQKPATHVFTSWHCRRDSTGRIRQSHVSIEVDLERHGADTVMYIRKWINGLAFFSQKEQESAIFGWPSSWS